MIRKPTGGFWSFSTMVLMEYGYHHHISSYLLVTAYGTPPSGFPLRCVSRRLVRRHVA